MTNGRSGIELLTEIDNRAEKLKNKILTSESSLELGGRCYYLSSNGNDRNNGLSPEAPWKTLERANEEKLCSGDALLLERNSVFRGTLVIEQENITVGAYGKGAKPKICGSFKNYTDSSDWLETEYEDLYVCAHEFETDVGLVVFDDSAASFKQVIKNFGFEGSLSEVNEDLQIFYDEPTKKLYLYCEGGNPSKRFGQIEICTHVSAVVLKNDHTVLDNLCIKYCGGHAVCGSNIDGLRLQNCEIGWVGGCKQFELADGRSVRYGNGVEIYVNCRNFEVRNSYFYQIYDAAMTHQFFIDEHKDILMENIVYCGNLIEYCNYSIEYALIRQTEGSQIMRNIVIEDNIMRFAGYGFGGQRPDKDGASHIKGWDICNAAENFVIRNNVFDRGKYMVIHASAEEKSFLPNFENNVYIQDAGGQWGRYGTTPTTLVTTDDSEEFFKFDKNAVWLVK